MTKTLQLLACATLMLTEAAGASPFEWDRDGRDTANARVLDVLTPSVDSIEPLEESLTPSAANDAATPIAVRDVGGRDQWVVRATAVFVPDSGATTFLDQLIHPPASSTSLAPTAAPRAAHPDHVQPLPASETRSRPLPEPPAIGRISIRYHGGVASLLPLSAGFLGLAVLGRRPRPRVPSA